MIPPGARVIAAVSGGADSLCLAAALMELRSELGFTLSVCHFNHRLRGRESEEDAAFVRAFAMERGLPYMEGSGAVAEESRRRGCGLEEAARDLRYAFFEEIAGESLVATAHTADDNAETLLMHLLRGAGPHGMGGIPPVRGRYIRPLLTTTRREVEAYLRERGLSHREDSSNEKDDNLRNRLRHGVMPALRELGPRFAENASFAALRLYEDDRFLAAEAEAFLRRHRRENRLPAAPLRELPGPLRRRVLLTMAGGAADRGHVAALEALLFGTDPSGAADLPGQRVTREYDELVFGAPRERESFDPAVLLPGVPTEIPELGLRFTLREASADSTIYNSFTNFLFKKAEVCGTITVRPRLAGDRLRLPGRGSRSLKKLFIDRKIPLSRRALLPVVADSRGVLAVPGVGADIRALPEKGEAAYYLQVEELNDDPSGCGKDPVF